MTNITTTQAVELATSTESVPANISINIKYLNSLCEIIISAGELLDQIKKHAFYGKEIDLLDTEKFKQHIKYGIKTLQSLESPDSNLTEIDVNTRTFHSIIGIVTESVELLQAIIPINQTDNNWDNVNISEELFDVNWYTIIGYDSINVTIDDAWSVGFDKLGATSSNGRYTNGFSSENAINRNIANERKKLEQIEKN